MKLWEYLRPKRQKLAALAYDSTINLGDEIQSLAAMQFLPRVDAFVDRERLDEFTSEDTHKLILNGWFLHRPEHWPPSASLKPLFISFHLTREMWAGFNQNMQPPATTVLSPSGLAYLRKHAPIGARDLDTLKQLNERDVDAYFSGCLTLTLTAPSNRRRGEDVYAVDVDDDVTNFFQRQCERPIIRLSHVDGSTKGSMRFTIARDLLLRYSTARSVVTKRLHCALPCLALGTPVLFVEDAVDAYRFDGLRDFLHCTSRDEILSGRCSFNPAEPAANSTSWHPLRDQLIGACRRFTGMH